MRSGASGSWCMSQSPMGELFHHAQFSWTDTGSKELTTFTGKPGKRGGRKGGKGDDGRWRQGKGNDDGHWRQNWDNTMVRVVGHDDDKHWKREAWCFGLAEVFARFGNRYTTKQLYQYYLALVFNSCCRAGLWRRSSEGSSSWRQRIGRTGNR